MKRDPIIKEIRRNRQVYAAGFRHDIKSICRAAREQQKKAVTKLFRCHRDLPQQL